MGSKMMLMVALHFCLVCIIFGEGSSTNGSKMECPDPLDYFPQVNGDASLITWAHAVNSADHLKEALSGDIMMLEADISLGKVTGTDENSESIAIMAHPPATTSDISLETWLNQTLQSNKNKGIKLDFKNITIVEPSLVLLASYKSQLNLPIFLNADILSGPTNSSAIPVDPNKFLDLVRQHFPCTILSVGWTTALQLQLQGYSWEQVIDMAKLLHDVQQPVTFPVRAVFLRMSYQQLKWLTDVVPGSGLTVWSAMTDIVDAKSLKVYLDSFKPSLIYYDLPSPLREEFDVVKQSSRDSSSSLSNLNWAMPEGGGCAFPGTEAIVFQKDCLAMYAEKYHGTAENPLTITGIIEFLNPRNLPQESLAIGARSSPWVWVKIYENGTIDRGYGKEAVSATSISPCYGFRMTDVGGHVPIDFQVWAASCKLTGYPAVGNPITFTVEVPSDMDGTTQLALNAIGNGVKVVHSLKIKVANSGSYSKSTILFTVIIVLLFLTFFG